MFDAIAHVEKVLEDGSVENDLQKRFDKFKIRWAVAIYYMAHRDLKKAFFNEMKSAFCGMDIRENRFVGPGEKLFYACARSLPHGLYRCTDAAITIYIHVFNRSLKEVMKPFGR